MPEFTGPELCAKSAVEVVDLLRKGDVSTTELIDASLTRMTQVEPVVNATPVICEDRARASVLDPSEVDHPGWLAGLPIGIKDLTAVAGVRSTSGTKGLADNVPKASNMLVERLEARGAVVLGKTNTPEFGAGGNTFNEVFGPTFNAWNSRLNAGGSSGGAAVSLATGEFWLSHGSDHGGSLRTPAAYNGIVGLRPSPGRVAYGSAAGYFIEGAQGPMARSVADCALFLDAMAGYEPRSPISFPAPDQPFQQAVARADGRLRIGFAPDLGGFAPVDADMDRYLRRAMAAVQAGGATVEEACPDLPDLERTYHTLRGMMWATEFRDAPAALTGHFKQTLRENLAFGRALTMDDIALANLNRTMIYNNLKAFLDVHDVLALPVVGNMPHAQSEEWVRQVGGQTLTGYMDWLRFAFLATVTGMPAMSVPVGLSDDGIPVGLQLIGPPRGEAKLLAAARAFEVAMGGPLGPIDPVVAG
ncbi:amidase family protein [Aliiroseovarius subalbicans]|uniref:amidase n=1 Tax=Aliiroseovarius subalbicans TaxID=2925840 RepID=UPI001F5697F4|nr:amidase family protein [Aliiroseovarius subalbicans]MCI2399163.1 amidase family protein [Aliiroseovarius subalbicans]